MGDDKLDHKEIRSNRAYIKGAEKVSCDNHGERFVFVMQDKYHKFSLDLETLLNCLRIAEEGGGVPPLPQEWWHSLISRYDV